MGLNLLLAGLAVLLVVVGVVSRVTNKYHLAEAAGQSEMHVSYDLWYKQKPGHPPGFCFCDFN